jgi:hypothetical protein
MEKALAKALERIMRAIMKVVAMILRMLGFGGGDVSGGGLMPGAPKEDDETVQAADPAKGLSPGRQQAMTMAILTYAGADRAARKEIDLSELPMIEKAYLKGCNDRTLTSIVAMQPKEALNFVLTQTQAARSQIMKPSRKTRRSESESDQGYEASGPAMDAGVRMAF